jgi:MFS family permease
MASTRATSLLLNAGHALDHLVMLIFASAVATIALDFGVGRWEDLMPYSAGAILLFGLGSLPAGRLGDLWGRRPMMLVFFFGLGASAIATAAATTAWQIAVALTALGAFASIYHPVGIPLLVQSASKPGTVIGINGLAGNLGVAGAAIVTGLLVGAFGWRAAFVLPGIVALACGVVFWRLVPLEREPPVQRISNRAKEAPSALLVRVFAVMTTAAATGSLLFNFTTNGNGQFLAERLRPLVTDASTLGAILAVVYVVASVAQLVVGRLIDRLPLRRLYLTVVLAQVPLFLLAAFAQGWWVPVALTLVMVMVFGAVPFTDTMVVRYVDDRMRSRVAGMRLTVAFVISSLAVWLLGPVVKAIGFATLFVAMALIALLTALAVSFLPNERTAESGSSGLSTRAGVVRTRHPRFQNL